MIIWGWKTRHMELDAGEFVCPQCRSQAPYRRIRVATYFTLYFIPLFPTQEHGEHIRCERCRGAFRLEVLDLPRSQAEELRSSLDTTLKRGLALQKARLQLISTGLTEAEADQLVKNAAGTTLDCSSCGLTFTSNRVRCSDCDSPLMG